MVNPLDQAYQDFLTHKNNFNVNNPGKENLFHAAGTDLENSMGSIVRAINAGDSYSAASQALSAMTSISSMLAVASPFGAVAGAILGAITALISAILDALKPATESMEAKLKRMIEEETLNQAYIVMAGGKAEWELAEKKIFMLAKQRQRAVNTLAAGGLGPADRAQYEAVAAGWTWEDLTQDIGWEKHKGLISSSFMALSKKRDLNSASWMALFDITIAYAFRFYLAFESMAGLVGDPPPSDSNQVAVISPPKQPSVASVNNVELFAELRKVVLRQFRDDIDSVYFEYQNKCQFYHLYKDNDRDYLNHKGYAAASFGKLGQRTGVIGDQMPTTDWLASSGGAANFAVTSRGTVFAVGTSSGGNQDVLYAGRGGGKWPKVEGAPKCDQVFVMEYPGDENVIVLALNNYGQTLSVCQFNDADGAGGEGSPQDWKPNKSRWGTWNPYDFTATGKTILTVLATPPSDGTKGYSVYALAYDPKSKDINLYGLFFGSLKMEEFGKGSKLEGKYKIAGNDVTEFMYSAELHKRSAPSPCAISYNQWSDSVPSFTVQYGHRMLVPAINEIQLWNLRDSHNLWDDEVKVYQGRHYLDGTIVLTTNKGVKMLYRLTPNDPTQWGYSTDIETTCSWKQPSTQARNCRAFYTQLNTAVNKLSAQSA